MRTNQTSQIIFGPIEDAEVSEIARRQPGCASELAELLDNKPRWAPLSAVQVRERLAEEQKKPQTSVFAIRAGSEFVGIGEWSASWDTLSPYTWFIVWPEHRRKGLGGRIANMLLDKCFLEHPGHVVVTAAADWNIPAIKFIKELGFADIGRMRRTHMQDGAHHDTLFFDILKPEYLGKGRGARR